MSNTLMNAYMSERSLMLAQVVKTLSDTPRFLLPPHPPPLASPPPTSFRTALCVMLSSSMNAYMSERNFPGFRCPTPPPLHPLSVLKQLFLPSLAMLQLLVRRQLANSLMEPRQE